ncbi:hypothetical protein L596_028237 [Steinernema carpocapsae]|uniref:Protein MAK10 homolog n=1 Tax=Steinernema carpocapsae TaxID=34508 RepID=A0A4U5LXU6_STECR|nr:hypothetical protein L596_028237 [Steinernema carpocapsae]
MTPGEPRRYIDITALPANCVDITEKFAEASEDLEVGEMVHTETFTLSDSMSAIEVLDSKMDVGMHKLPLDLTLKGAIEGGRINVVDMPNDEIIATMDCTIAALATWLHGQSLDSTVFTNILLQDVNLIEHQALRVFHKAILEIVQHFKEIIQATGTFRDEDILVHFYADIHVDTMNIGLELDNALVDIDQEVNAYEREVANGQIHHNPLRCVRERLIFVKEILNVTKHYFGFEPLQDNASNSTGPSFKPNFDDGKKACKACGTCIMLMTRTYEEFGKNPERDDDIENKTDDFLYEWLPAFISELNRRYVPAAFPRKKDLMSRIEALNYFDKLFLKLERIPRDLPGHVPGIDRILEDLRTFSEDSCVLSRCMAQLVVIPNENSIFGVATIKEVIFEAIRGGIDIQRILNTKLAKKMELTELLERFLDDASKCFMGAINLYGLNTARQRDAISDCLSDFGNLITTAAEVDTRLLEFMKLLTQGGDKDDLVVYQIPSVYGYILHHAFSLMYYHCALGFRLGLFEEYEFPYIYWYLQRVNCQWFTCIDHRGKQLFEANKRINDKQMGLWEKRVKGQLVTVPTRALTEQEQQDSRMRCAHLDACHSWIEKGRYQGLLCEAMFKFAMGLIRSKFIPYPFNEDLRFHTRFSHFGSIGEIFGINYLNFQQDALKCATHTGPQLFSEGQSIFLQIYNIKNQNGYIPRWSRSCSTCARRTRSSPKFFRVKRGK